jgi:hypothetical protein
MLVVVLEAAADVEVGTLEEIEEEVEVWVPLLT